MEPNRQAQRHWGKDRCDFIESQAHGRNRHRQNHHASSRVSRRNIQKGPSDQGWIRHAKHDRQVFVSSQPKSSLGSNRIKKGRNPSRPFVTG